MASNIVEVESNSSEIVPEDPEYLTELETHSKLRYTDQDEDYIAVKTSGNSKPPIQLPHPSNDKGQNSYSGRRGYGRRSYNGYQRRDCDRESDGYERRSYTRWQYGRY